MNASGRVAGAGSINVTLSTGIKRAVGFGRLNGMSGPGTWRHVRGNADGRADVDCRVPDKWQREALPRGAGTQNAS